MYEQSMLIYILKHINRLHYAKVKVRFFRKTASAATTVATATDDDT